MSLPSPSSVIVNTCRAAYCTPRSDYVDSRYKRRSMCLPSVVGSRNHGRSNCGCYGGQPRPGADLAGGEPSPGVDLAGASPVSAQMWEGEPNSRRRCGRGELSPGAALAGASQSRRRCGSGEPSPGPDVERASPVPVQMWRASPVPAQMWRQYSCFGTLFITRSAMAP
jgi:hypothetical protein